MKKYLSAVILLLVITLSLFACSSDKKSTSKSKSSSSRTETTKKDSTISRNLLVKSAENTQKQKSVEIKGTISLNGDGTGLPVNGDLLISGVQSFEKNESQISIDMTSLFGSLGGGGVESTDPIIIETRTVDGFTYTKTPSILGSASSWKKAKAVSASGNSTQDPSQFLEYFKGAKDDYKTIGKEDIDGVSTTQYQVTLSPENLKKQAKASGGDLSDDSIEAIEKTFTKDIVANVWIDKNSLIKNSK